MQFDTAYINDTYPTNKLFTNTVMLSKALPTQQPQVNRSER
jgi:hypothetical protein